MSNPSFWKNLFLVLAIAANFAFSAWWVVRKAADAEPAQPVEAASDASPHAAGKTPVAWRIVARTFSVIYAAVSFLLLCAGAVYFCEMEFSDSARECWRRSRDWPQIKVGMTKQQAHDILGDPHTYDTWNESERLKYRLHPLDLPDAANVAFNLPAAGEQKVIEKYPADEDRAAYAAEWLPPPGTYRSSALIRQVLETVMIFSLVGLVLLTITTLIPAWPTTNWHSISLYFPAAALVFCIGYESGQKGGWRFDLFFLYPMYGVILLVWLFRVIHCVSK